MGRRIVTSRESHRTSAAEKQRKKRRESDGVKSQKKELRKYKQNSESPRKNPSKKEQVN